MLETAVVLRPGDFCFAGDGTVIRTLLGSCVSITAWHPARQIGGMCHYVVPSRRGPSPGDLDGRYADEAVAMFLREMAAHATWPQDYEIKIFGGGSQFREWTGEAPVDVPTDNIAAGLRLLSRNGLTVSAQHLGGTGHRQVVFETASGNVWLKHVQLDVAVPA